MKGQTAIEYLMTWKWYILIILIVAGVLFYFGIVNPSAFLPTQNQVPASVEMIYQKSFKLSALFCTELACNENLKNISLMYNYDNLKEHCQELELWYPEECE